MRKFGYLIRNIYRVLVVRPDGKRMVLDCTENEIGTEEGILPEALLKRIVAADDCIIETDSSVQHMLEQRVAKNGQASGLTRNSLLEMFLPVFSLKNFELKMAVICLALVFTLGIGPTDNHSFNRNNGQLFLADTLMDSSLIHPPLLQDSAFKINFK